MERTATVRARQSTGSSAHEESEPSRGDHAGRLTIYTTRKKEFAVRYLALKEDKSVSKLLDELLDSVLQKAGIDPETLPEVLP